MNIRIIKLFVYHLIMLSVLIVTMGCEPSYSKEDSEKLNAIKAKYGNTFDFELEEEFYLKVALKKNEEITQDRLIEIYKMFSFNNNTGKRRNTKFVYLNYYDSQGKFQYQISYNPQTDSYNRDTTEHY